MWSSSSIAAGTSVFKPFGGESQNLRHRLGRKARIVPRNVFAAHSLRQAGEDVGNRKPGSLDRRLSPQKVAIGNDPLIAGNNIVDSV